MNRHLAFHSGTFSEQSESTLRPNDSTTSFEMTIAQQAAPGYDGGFIDAGVLAAGVTLPGYMDSLEHTQNFKVFLSFTSTSKVFL